jgi:hypothetical protein
VDESGSSEGRGAKNRQARQRSLNPSEKEAVPSNAHQAVLVSTAKGPQNRRQSTPCSISVEQTCCHRAIKHRIVTVLPVSSKRAVTVLSNTVLSPYYQCQINTVLSVSNTVLTVQPSPYYQVLSVPNKHRIVTVLSPVLSPYCHPYCHRIVTRTVTVLSPVLSPYCHRVGLVDLTDRVIRIIGVNYQPPCCPYQYHQSVSTEKTPLQQLVRKGGPMADIESRGGDKFH